MTEYIDYSAIEEALRLILTEHTEADPDELLDMLEDAVGNNADAIVIPDDDDIAGQTIVGVREMTDEEFERESFRPDNMRDGNPPVIELANGRIIFASADPEGNSAGEIFGQMADGTAFAIEHPIESES